jgi:hypothetical protein
MVAAANGARTQHLHLLLSLLPEAIPLSSNITKATLAEE